MMRMLLRRHQRNRWAFLFSVVCALFWLCPVVCHAKEPERLEYAGPVVAEGQTIQEPEEFLEQNGKQYRLISSEIKEIQIQGTDIVVSTQIPYELEGMQEVPKSAIVTLHDDITGNPYEREVPFMNVKEKEQVWRTDFSFPVTVFGYGAEVFYLGNREVASTANLADYGEYLLEYLGLSLDCYRVDRVEWSGAPYENEGTMCRDATAYGEKLIRHVDVTYGGEVRTPDYPAKQYLAVYEEVLPETEEERSESHETIELTEEDTEPVDVNEPESQETLIERVSRWIKEHVTVIVFSSMFFLCFLGGLILLYTSSRKKKDMEAHSRIQ